MMNHNHLFHLVTFSPWLLISISIFTNLICSISWFHNFYSPHLILSIPNTLIYMSTSCASSSHQGCHSTYMFSGMKMSMILFIMSEIFFLIPFSDHIFIHL